MHAHTHTHARRTKANIAFLDAPLSFRQSVQVALRSFKNLFHEARERATKALGFAKKLTKVGENKQSEAELTASGLKKDPKHTKGLRECFLI